MKRKGLEGKNVYKQIIRATKLYDKAPYLFLIYLNSELNIGYV